MPNVIFMDSYDHYAAADIAKKGWTNNGSVSITASAGRGSSFALVIDQSTNGGGATLALPASQATGYVEFAVKFSAMPGSDKPFLHFMDSGTVHVDLRLTSAGALRVTRAGTSLNVTGSGVITTGTYYHIGLKVTVDDAAGAYDLRVNGTSLISGTAQDTRNGATATFNQLRLQNFWADAVSLTFDDFIVSTDGFCGDCRVQVVLPQAAGNYSQWTPSVGSGYTCVDETSMNSDTDYVSSATPGQRNSYDFTSIATGAIKAVQQVTSLRKDDAGTRTVKQFARIGTTDYDGSAASCADTYVMQRRVMPTSPATSTDWTLSELNAAEFGTLLVS